MKKQLSPILDPESVPLRINFARGERLTDEDVALGVKALAVGIERWPDRSALPSEIVVVSRSESRVILLVGWVEQSEADRLFHSVEKAFPSAVSAHLGSDALEDELTTPRLPGTCLNLGFELISGQYVADRDGVPKLVPPYWKSRRAVCLREFEKFVEDTGYQTAAEIECAEQGFGSTWRDNDLLEMLTAEQRSDHAVTLVSKVDALAYCQWASVRLPTEHEWLAAHIRDWFPLDKRDSSRNAKRKRLFQEFDLEHPGGWWTSTLDASTGKSVIRYGGGSLLESNWSWTDGRVQVDPEYTELLLSFEVAKDI